MTMNISLLEDQIDGATVWTAAPRAIFVRSGRFSITSDTGSTRQVSEADCQLFTRALRIEGAGELWTFEVAGGTVADLSAATQRRCIVAHDIDLDPNQPFVMRADRVEFPAGMETPRHGHKAAGIRRLYRGRLVAEIGKELRRIDEDDAWFETGHDPVIGRNIADSSAFVRTLVLPLELHGQSTFIAWDETEAAKPRGTLRTEYFDTVVQFAH